MLFTKMQIVSLLFLLSYPAAQILPCLLSSPWRVAATPCLPHARLSWADVLLCRFVFCSKMFTAVSRASTKTSYYLGLGVLVPNNCCSWLRTVVGEATALCMLGCPPSGSSDCLRQQVLCFRTQTRVKRRAKVTGWSGVHHISRFCWNTQNQARGMHGDCSRGGNHRNAECLTTAPVNTMHCWEMGSGCSAQVHCWKGGPSSNIFTDSKSSVACNTSQISSEPPSSPCLCGKVGCKRWCAIALLLPCVPERFRTSLAPAAVCPAEVNVNWHSRGLNQHPPH